MIIDFEKDPDGRWYAVLPSWDGDREELEMVCGADKLLDLLVQGEFDYYSFDMYSAPIDDCSFILNKLEDTPEVGGATYWFSGEIHGIKYEFDLWLCDVTRFVFGELPDKIYVKV